MALDREDTDPGTEAQVHTAHHTTSFFWNFDQDIVGLRLITYEI
jgi:hypothetical protein